jgi:hypothetical protein
LFSEGCNVLGIIKITFDMLAIMNEWYITSKHNRLEAKPAFVKRLTSELSRTGLVKYSLSLLCSSLSKLKQIADIWHPTHFLQLDAKKIM